MVNKVTLPEGLIASAAKGLLRDGVVGWMKDLEASYSGAEYSNPKSYEHAVNAESNEATQGRLIAELNALIPNLQGDAQGDAIAARSALMAAKTPTEIKNAIAAAEAVKEKVVEKKGHAEHAHQQRMNILLGEMHKAAKAMDDHLREALGFVEIPDEEKKLKKLAELEAAAAKDLFNEAAQNKYHQYQDNLKAEVSEAVKHLPPEQRAKAERSLESAEEDQKRRNQKEQAIKEEKKQADTHGATDMKEYKSEPRKFGEEASYSHVAAPTVKHSPKSTGNFIG